MWILLVVLVAVGGLIGVVSSGPVRERFFLPRQLKKLRRMVEEGRASDALPLLRALEESYKGHTDVTWLKAKCESALGHYLIAIVSLNDLVRDGEWTDLVDEAAVRRELAVLYEKSGREHEALTEYYLLIDREPDNAAAHLKIGRFHWQQRNYAEAERFLKKAAGLDDVNPEPFLLLSRIYQDDGRHPEAEPYLAKLIDMAPENGEVHFRLGLQRMSEGHFESATPHLERSIELGGETEPRAAVQLALCEENRGRLAEACDLLEGALPRLHERPDEARHAYDVLSRILTRMRAWSRLQSAVEARLRVDKDDPDAKAQTELFKHLFESQALRTFFEGESAAVRERARQMLERLAFTVDEDQFLEEDVLLFRTARVTPGHPRLRELVVWIWKPEPVHRGLMTDIAKLSKTHGVRTTLILTPFDFSAESNALAKTMSMNLFNGVRLLAVLTGNEDL